MSIDFIGSLDRVEELEDGLLVLRHFRHWDEAKSGSSHGRAREPSLTQDGSISEIAAYLKRCGLPRERAEEYARKLVDEVGCTAVNDLRELKDEEWEQIVTQRMFREKIQATLAKTKLARGKSKQALAGGEGEGGAASSVEGVSAEQVAPELPAEPAATKKQGGGCCIVL